MALTKVTGELVDIGDLDISNVGSIQLDSIAGDADSNTSITFSGSDVITVATGGSTAATFNADQTTTFSGAVTFNGPNLNITADDARLLVEEADGTNIGWYGDITGGGVGGCFLYNHGGTATVQLRADATASFINNGANFGIGTASPQGGLHLVGPSSGQVELYLSDADEGTGASDSLLITKSGTSSYIYDRDASSSLRLGAADNHSILFIDGSNQRVGIGTTSPDCTLEVNGSANSEQVIITGTDNRGLSISTAANGGQNDAHVIFNAQDTGHADYPTMSFQTGGTERMRLTPDGKLTVGATTANHKIEAHSGAVASKYDGTDHIAIRALSGGQYIQYGSGRALTFMRIDTYPNSGASHTMSLSGSKVRIGASSPSLAGLLSVEGGNAGVPALFVSNTNTDSVGIRSQVNSNGAGNYIYYAVNSGGGVWKIRNDGDHSGTDTSIGSLSDSRLKKDVTDLTYDINKFKQYRPVEFNWKNPSLHKSASGKSRGFLAQEIGAIDTYYVDKYEAQGDDIPLVDEDGMAHGTKFGYKDAMYISVIKQLITRLEAAEAKITALEG